MSQPKRICSVNGCGRAHNARSFCVRHYNQWRRNPDSVGDPIRAHRDLHERDELGRKHCPVCDEWRPEPDFNANIGKSDGLQWRCRECASDAYRRNRLHVRDKMRKQRYGLTRDQFDALFALQGNCCAICKATSPGRTFWAVDHDHGCCPGSEKTCGECVRGILCGPCNKGIGHLRDSVDNLRSAITYLVSARTL